MPIDGKLYQAAELQKLLKVKKQRISNLARDQNWEGPQPGLYWAECVEPYLMGRNIDPLKLPIQTFYDEID